MKKRNIYHPLFVFSITLLLMMFIPFGFAKSPVKTTKMMVKKTSSENYSLYTEFNLCDYGLSFKAFNYALNGFYELQSEGFFQNNRILTIIDFSKPATEKRLFVLDLISGKILFNTLVAHGQQSGALFAKYFSNIPSSLKSSIGFFETAQTYIGKHGYSLKLNGLEQGINDQVNRRAIVIHGADYVSESYIKRNGLIGRSWGCPAVPSSLSKPIIDEIKDGSCLFIYAEDLDYWKKSKLKLS